MATEVAKASEQAAAGVPAPVAKAKRPKRLTKEIKGTVVVITEGDTKTVMNFDFSKLPAAIQTNLGPFGLGHKLGDAAAGQSGKDAVDAINKVFEGLMKGDWSVRAPKADKVTVSDITAKLQAMPEADRVKTEAALRKVMDPATLAKLGIK